MTTIFISYRRGDSSGVAGRIFDHLTRAFAPEAIFLDVDNVPYGVDFVEVLRQRVSVCSVLLAVIGRDWSGDVAGSGRSRLFDSHDWVRVEIESALRRDIPVIPVLIDGTLLPKRDALPRPLWPLLRRNAIEVAHTRFAMDADRLITALEGIVPAQGGVRRQPIRHGERDETAPAVHGGYQRSAFEFYEGVYAGYRRSFKWPEKFIRSIYTIAWSPEAKCLRFGEDQKYIVDRRLIDHSHSGDVYVSAMTGLIHLVTIFEGAVRMLTLTKMRRSDWVMRGILLTQSETATHFRPTTSAVYLEKLIDDNQHEAARGDVGPIDATSALYDAIRQQIEAIEADIVQFTGLGRSG